jgi:CheY-like chemotaxis protein
MEDSLSGETREALVDIGKSCERAALLTRQLLQFSRRQIMQPETQDLNVVVTDLETMLRRTLGESTRLTLELHPEPLPVHADLGMLTQVVLNLTVNARDAMPRGGTLRIRTSLRAVDEEEARRNPGLSAGQYAHLRVSDSGSGIPPEILPRIFDPFFTTKEPGSGTGLGLATVFGIVKQHHGWVEVESARDQGATFHIDLPLTAKGAEVRPAKAAPPRPRGGSETILLAEDDPDVRNATRAVLERHGYTVLQAGSGPEALSIFRRHGGRVDLLLTDVVMPEGLDGRQLAARLLPECPGLKVIFMSGYSAELAGGGAAFEPGQRFLEKPCSLDHLVGAVRECLDRPAATRSDAGAERA